MFTGVFRDRTRTRQSRRSPQNVLAQLLRAKSLRPHVFRRSEVGPYMIEYVCLERWLIVELRNPTANESTARARIALLNELGYSVIQVTKQTLFEHPDKVLARVRQRLAQTRK